MHGAALGHTGDGGGLQGRMCARECVCVQRLLRDVCVHPAWSHAGVHIRNGTQAIGVHGVHCVHMG